MKPTNLENNPTQSEDTEARCAVVPCSEDIKIREVPAAYTAVKFVDCGGKAPLLYYAMPCGNVYELKRGDRVPDEDIPCPCGDPNHWLVKIEKRDHPATPSPNTQDDTRHE
jgi:hypothetical protein